MRLALLFSQRSLDHPTTAGGLVKKVMIRVRKGPGTGRVSVSLL